MDIVAPNQLDERRIEVLVDGLPLFHGAQVDTTLVSALRRRTRLVVLAAEVGGRWSQETAHFLLQLAKAKVHHEPKVMRVSAQCSWLRRRRCLLACTAAQAFTLSLLDCRAGLGSDGKPHQPHLMWLVIVATWGCDED